MTAETDRFEQGYADVQAWAQELQQQGWLSEAELNGLQRMETSQADELFNDAAQRPLLVAFFGGTGVGKSSLLNRLAGKAIAEVGVIRPTSHHVTLYLHESFRGSLHEQSLPTEQTRIAYHADESKKYFAWLDMPDIDSTEQTNRAVVEHWLPVIDWLIYVVTPDRYHDDLGWKFVQSRGHQHAWLFVMNHWDEGVAEQWDDFRGRLVAQGFTDPVVLRTSCEENLADDDFKQLDAQLQQALQNHGIESLRHVALARRWQSLLKQIKSLHQQLAKEDVWQAVKQQWKTLGDESIGRLNTLLNSNAKRAYQQWKLAEEAGNSKLPVLQLTASQASDSATASGNLNQIYDKRSDDQLKTQGLAIENIFSANGLPLKPVQAHSHALAATAQEAYLQAIEAGLANSLQKPGNVFTRLFRRLLKFCQWVLPLSAALWAGYHIISGFYSSTQGEEAFLGINFAVHSLLMMGLAWLIPWFTLKQTQPSYAKTAYVGIEKGILAGSEQFQESLQQAWHGLETDKTNHLNRLKQIEDNYAQELNQDAQVLTEFMCNNSA